MRQDNVSNCTYLERGTECFRPAEHDTKLQAVLGLSSDRDANTGDDWMMITRKVYNVPDDREKQ